MEKYGFVYIWRDRKRKKYYIGCHWGNKEDGYICSSNYMSKAYKRRPDDFSRRILVDNILDRQSTFNEEYKWLQLIREEDLGKKYYNFTKHKNSHWTLDEKKRSSVSKKLSKASKGNTWENPGKWKKGQRISIATEFGNKPAWNKGKKLEDLYEDQSKIDSYRKNLSDSHKGLKMSSKNKEILRKSWVGENNPNAKAIATPYGEFKTITNCIKETKISRKKIMKMIANKNNIEWELI